MFLYLVGLLLVERLCRDVPVQVHVPLRFTFYVVRIVEHLFGLQAGVVVARVPHAVVVGVNEETGVVDAWLDVVERGIAVGGLYALHRLVFAAEQFDADVLALQLLNVQHHATVVVERTHLETFLQLG